MFKRKRGELPVVSVLLLIALVVSTGSIVAVVFYSAVNQNFFSNEEVGQNITPQPVGAPTIKPSFSNFQKTSSLPGEYYDSFDISIKYISGPTDRLYIFDVDVTFDGKKLDEFAEWEISETTAISSMDANGEFTGYEQTKNIAYIYRVKLSDPFHTIAHLPEQKFAFEITMGLTKGVPSYYYFGRYGESVKLESFVRPYNITLLGGNPYHFNLGLNDETLLTSYGEAISLILIKLAIDNINNFFQTNYNTTLLNITGEWTTTDGLLKIGTHFYFLGIPPFTKQERNLNYPGDSAVINNTDIFINADWLINSNSQSLLQRAETNSIPMLFFGGSITAQIQANDYLSQYSGEFVKEDLTEEITGVKDDSFDASDSYPSGFCSQGGTPYLRKYYTTSSNWTTSDADLNALKSGITFSNNYDNPYNYVNQKPYTQFGARGITNAQNVASFGGLRNKYQCVHQSQMENYTYTEKTPSAIAVLKHKNVTANTPAVISMPVPDHLMGLGCPPQQHQYTTSFGYWVRGDKSDLVNEIKEFFQSNWNGCLILGRLVQNSIIYLLFGREGYDAWLDEFEGFTSKRTSSKNKLNLYQTGKNKASFSIENFKKIASVPIHTSSSDLSTGVNLAEDLQVKIERWLKPKNKSRILQKTFQIY